MPDARILMGVLGRPHGVRGLMHAHSYTADPADLPDYGPFVDDGGRRWSLSWASNGVARVAEIVDGRELPVADRNGAEKLVNVRLYVDREQLPATDEDEFYLADLVGLEAIGAEGVSLGRVDAVHDYGAGASLEIGSLMVPFTREAVPHIDLVAGRITVAPPAEVVAQ